MLAARRRPGPEENDVARIVVTGGAGFLGSHLVDAIRARGDAVVVVDNLVTGSLDNLAHHDGDRRGRVRRARRLRRHLPDRAGGRRAAPREPGLAAGLPGAARSRP